MNRSSSVPPKTKMTIGLVDKLFKKLPYSYQRDIPIVKEAVRGKSKNFYEYLSKNNVPKYIEVDKTKDSKRVKFEENLNSFQKIFYEYNVQRKSEMKNYIRIQKENKSFCDEYHQIQKKKAKGLKNPYVTNEAIISIINEYSKYHTKIPDLSVEKNIFKEDPLILGDEELERFFLFHQKPGLDKKALSFLNKIGEKVQEKIQITALDRLKRKRINNDDKIIDKKEKKEIHQSEKEIKQTENALKNIEEIDDFFKTRPLFKKIAQLNLKSNKPSSINSSRKISNAAVNNKNVNLQRNPSPNIGYLSTNATNQIVKIKNNLIQRSISNKKLRKKNDIPPIINKSAILADTSNNSLEKIYHESLDLENSKKHLGDIKNYLLKNKYNIDNNDVSTKISYSQIKHVKDLMTLKNFIMEDYDIRRDRNTKIALSERQVAILAKNKKIENNLTICEKILKRLLYEGKLEKECYSL